jgi:hypothetical protein
MKSPVKLVRRRGWIAFPKADLALLNEQCGGSSATTCVTWLALLIIANDRRQSTFKVHINVIRHLAGPSLRTVKTALQKLVELDFVKIEPNLLPGSKERDANTYTLLRFREFVNRTSCNQKALGHANSGAFSLHGNSEQSASACQTSASAPKELVTGGAAANAGARHLSSANGSIAPRKW